MTMLAIKQRRNPNTRPMPIIQTECWKVCIPRWLLSSYSLPSMLTPRPSTSSSLTWLNSRFISQACISPSLVVLVALLVLAEFGPEEGICWVLMGCGQISFHFFSHVFPGIFFLQPSSSIRDDINSHFCFSMYSFASLRYWICCLHIS